MIGTLTSLILALLFLLSPLGQLLATSWNLMAISIIIVASLFILLPVLIQAISWSPLQRAEKLLTPRLFELKKQDKILLFDKAWLILFPLLSYSIALFGNVLEAPSRIFAWAAWLFLLGISLDVLQHLIKRVSSYLNPYAVLDHFSHVARTSIQNDRELEVCDSADALSEMAVKSIQESGSALPMEVLGKMSEIFKRFMEASKSLTHHERDKETQALGISDKISYTLFYFMQRLELINRKAVDKQLEPVSSKAVTTLGNMILQSAKLDISLAAFPVQSLGKCALAAQQNKMPEVGVKATITLVEVARTILEEIDVTYLELKDPYTAIVAELKDIAQEAFKQDKSLSIPVLKQPLVQVRGFFTGEKMAGHADTPVILDAIDRAIGEFDALEMVLRTIPPFVPPEEPPPEEAPPKEEKSAKQK
ncbi:MAG: hypothetical protein LLG04_14755 [Parachlamydia sp.]|nr:hypothetical protein [Parachlamydia sp.]